MDAPERYSERPQHASRSKVDSDQAHEQRRLGFEEVEYGSVRVALSTILERAEEVGCVGCEGGGEEAAGGWRGEVERQTGRREGSFFSELLPEVGWTKQDQGLRGTYIG